VVAWVGDGNNMANTWLQAADILGFTLHVSTPGGYEIDAKLGSVNNPNCVKTFNHPMPSSCIACPRTAAKRSRPR
jgi:ornithine carbamoyltransferase